MTETIPTAASSVMGDEHSPPPFLHIVITGGPGAGKTTALAALPEDLEARDYGVLTVPEAATMLALSGFPIHDAVAQGGQLLWDFNVAIVRMQIQLREVYEDLAIRLNAITGKRFVLLHDRGICDNKAYIGAEKFEQMLDEVGIDMFEARDRYDVVVHMVSAADGAEEFYTTENNAARTETVEQARAMDPLTRGAWHGHEHLKVIDNSTDFEAKIARVRREVLNALQAPPTEFERKFLLSAMPAAEHLESAVQTEMLQTYLMSAEPGTELRIRQSAQGRHLRWSMTRKRKLATGGRAENGESIDPRTYQMMMHSKDPSRGTVSKTRHSFTSREHYFELDEFHNPEGVVVLEVELAEQTERVTMPDWLQELVVREVTDDPAYSTHALAARAS
jgi:CYTH domain-containing protein/predicted ATPase